jgi:hypothetical protein
MRNSQMTVRNLMAGYTAYTNAEELTAMRGTHRDVLVTTTDTGTWTTGAGPATDLDGPDTATDAPVLVIVRQGR